MLTLDRGNSTLDGMWHGDPVFRSRVDPSDVDAVADLLARHPSTTAGMTVAGLTVVPRGLDSVERTLAARGVTLQLAGRELPCPLRLSYRDVEGLGVDRWVGAYAAWRLYGAAVVVDCGTALTVNLVTTDGAQPGHGVFLGGAIAPGAVTMANALAEAAPALPVVDLNAPLELPALDPSSAVASGVQLAFCGAVERLVADLREASGLASAPIVLTGGGAELYARHGLWDAHHHPDLTHQGLRWLAEARDSSS